MFWYQNKHHNAVAKCTQNVFIKSVTKMCLNIDTCFYTVFTIAECATSSRSFCMCLGPRPQFGDEMAGQYSVHLSAILLVSFVCICQCYIYS